MNTESSRNSTEKLVVIGAGCAGVEVALAARSDGWRGDIALVGEEQALPYHRPPLSKGYLAASTSRDALNLRTMAAFDAAEIALQLGVRVNSVDRVDRIVKLSNGTQIPYDRLVLATGGRPRTLPGLDCSDVSNAHYLRTVEDADRLRGAMLAGRNMVIIGGGYIGLEVAATATKAGLNVTVLESAPRLLARVTAPVLSSFYQDIHRAKGVVIRTEEQITRIELNEAGTAVAAVHCLDGSRLACDVLVIGIGLVPNCELAEQMGLATNDGILVDASMCTSAPHIYAAGDCARSDNTLYGRSVRVESVPNALEQARKIAAVLSGKPPRPDAPPWFWSDQYDLSLKMVGLSTGYDDVVIRGSIVDKSFCAFYLQGPRLLAADTVNRAIEFNFSKQLIARQTFVDPEKLADDTYPFKNLLEH